ncbi:MAG: hypothetical protein ACFCD0_10915 [Gemmataceae bacterium]
MTFAIGLFYLTSGVPIWFALRANRDRPLLIAVVWGILAWICWGIVIVLAALFSIGVELYAPRQVALAMTGCVGVAVLGARRPGVGAWNFVVVSLFFVLMLPMLQSWLLSPESELSDKMWDVFVIAPWALLVLDYLPTNLALAALSLAAGCSVETYCVFQRTTSNAPSVGWLFLAAAPWVGWIAWLLEKPTESEFDRLWLDFRNRYGFVWAQRSREQFNRSAENNQWPVSLAWHGLQTLEGNKPPDNPQKDAMLQALRGVLKRFLPERQTDKGDLRVEEQESRSKTAEGASEEKIKRR